MSKKAGDCYTAGQSGEISLIELLKKEYAQSCALCHRIDRNTGGLVIVARNELVLKAVTDAISKNKIKKYYKTILCGRVYGGNKSDKNGRTHDFSEPRSFIALTSWHFKDAKKGRVYIYDFQKKYSKKIITEYRILSYNPENDTTLIEARLITGRTHQIRAQFAHIGFPVAGDGKYGRNAVNKKLPYRYQALWAWKIDFCGALKKFGIPDVFISEPDFI